VALAARCGGVDEQRLTGFGVGEGLAVDIEAADLGVLEALFASEPEPDLRPGPQAGEFRALLQQGTHHLAGERVVPVAHEVISQQRCHGPAGVVVVAWQVQPAGGGIGEPSVDGTPGEALIGGLVTTAAGVCLRVTPAWLMAWAGVSCSRSRMRCIPASTCSCAGAAPGARPHRVNR